jgi:hypothetical protein
VPPERAVLVPGEVGDALDDVERLEQRLDPVAARRAVDVAVAGETREPLEAVVVDQPLDRGRHLVEVLHAHEEVVPCAVARPPRPIVTPRVRGRGSVHVA